MRENIRSIKQMILGAFLALAGLHITGLVLCVLAPLQMGQTGVQGAGVSAERFLSALFQLQCPMPLLCGSTLLAYGLFAMHREFGKEPTA